MQSVNTPCVRLMNGVTTDSAAVLQPPLHADAAALAHTDCYLPDFSSARAVVTLLLISQLVAVILTVATGLLTADFFFRLAQVSLLMVWVSLTAASALSLARPLLSRCKTRTVTLYALLLVLLCVAAVSEAVYWFGQYFAATRLVETTALFPAEHAPYLLRNLVLGLLVTSIALRYFYISHQWRNQIERAAESRIAALQARIRPHFLFNSMNTIAALIRSEPLAAEQAVEDLSDLFRASLAHAGQHNTLREELEIARVYERMEQQRLGSRLTVEWQVDALPEDVRLPGLTLQPLLENAIYHGIEPLEQGGVVTIRGTTDNAGRVTMRVTNPVPVAGRHRSQGHQLALDNIRQRLALAFGDQAGLSVSHTDERFEVTLQFPRVQ